VVRVAKEDAINGARFAYAAYDAFQAAVAQELGLGRTLALQAKALGSLGAAQGEMLKQQAGIEEADIQTVARLLLTMLDSAGFGTEIVEVSPRRVAYKAARCPVYEAGQMMGVDQATIEAGCRSGAICFVDAVVQRLNPSLRCRLHAFRTGADDGCVEEIVVA